MNFLKVAKLIKFAVESDRNRKISQKVRKIWAFLEKKDGFSEEILKSWETAEGSKCAVKCDRIGRIPHKVREKREGLEKRWIFQKKDHEFSQKG